MRQKKIQELEPSEMSDIFSFVVHHPELKIFLIISQTEGYCHQKRGNEKGKIYPIDGKNEVGI